ncbi:MAG: prepilin-type N-terminal cleavage/methylation domain-containing protein [Burkholderiales bacterium]|nr:prepilin-type N-terminal cleavage/methylation domain-containing protein [Burkholderiales bacterium]
MSSGGERGFTLLELMIGLALLGLIMTLIFAGLQLVIRGWDEAEATGERSNRIRLVRALLTRELEAVYPYRWKNSADMNLAFMGGGDSLRFVSSTPPRAGQGGLNLVEFAVAGSAQGVRLLMRRQIPQREQRDFDRLEEVEGMVLLEGLDGAAFEYYGSDTPAGRPSWRDRWEDLQRLPQLVRVSLRPKGRPAWPDVVVALHVNEAAGCRGWDAVNERCHQRAAQ